MQQTSTTTRRAAGWRAGGESRRGGFSLYLAVAIAMAVVLAACFIAKKKALAFYDVGADTMDVYYPLQLAVARQLQAWHEITWSFDISLGGYLGTTFDPLWFVTAWLPESWQLSLRLPMFLLRIVAAGAFFYGYLRRIGLFATLAVIGGLGYAFCSYGLVNAQWDAAHGTEFVQFSAFLLLLESYLQRRRWPAAVAGGIVVGLGPAIGLYLFVVFAIAYGAARLLLAERGQRRALAAGLLHFALWSVVGLAVTAPLLLPAAYYLIDSPRVVSGYARLQTIRDIVFSLNPVSTIGQELAGLLGKDLLGSGSHYVGWDNYFEGPGFYVGLLPLLCLPQLGARQATPRQKRLLLVGVGGCALYFVWPALREAVYGFGLGHLVFRFSTLWISALLLVLGLSGLQRALTSGWWRGGIVLGAAGVLAITLGALACIPRIINVEQVVRVLAFAAFYTAFAFVAAEERQPRRSTMLLVFACACELLLFALPPLVERDVVNADGSSPKGRYDDGTPEALAYLRELEPQSPFFRIEKTYTSIYLNDALAQGYPGTATYFFNAPALTRFVDRMELPRPVDSANFIGSMAERRKVLDLLGVRYLLARNRDPDDDGTLTRVATVAGIEIYRNERARGFASFYDAIAAEADADALTKEERDEFLLGHVVVDDPAAVRDRLARLPASGPAARRSAAVRRVGDDELAGNVETPAASLLLLTLPFDRGWDAWLDGEQLDLFRADYGLTATLVPAGAHALVLRYSPPGRRLGFSLLGAAVAFLVVFAAMSRRAAREG